jgi:hypothetical protein
MSQTLEKKKHTVYAVRSRIVDDSSKHPNLYQNHANQLSGLFIFLLRKQFKKNSLAKD